MSEKQTIPCRACGCKQSRVVNTYNRTINWSWQGKRYEKTIIRRRRACRYCKFNFTTVETYEAEEDLGHPENIEQDPPEEPKDIKNGGNPFL